MDRIVACVLPQAALLARWERRVVAGLFGLIAALIASFAVSVVDPSPGLTSFANDWIATIVFALSPLLVAHRALRAQANRLALTLLALALTFYGLGDVAWTFWIGRLAHPPIPSICDALWLCFYPLTLAGLALYVRGGNPRSLRAVIDGITVGCAVTAVGGAVVLGPIMDVDSSHSVAVLTELAYPFGDVLLIGCVMGVLNLDGWRLDRTWVLLAGGFLLFAVADCAYASQVSRGGEQYPQIANLGYLVGVAMIPLAVWQPQHDDAPLPNARAVTVPAGFAAVALGLLLYDHLGHLNSLAYGLGVAALLASIVRMSLAFKDVRILAEARWQAGTDDLTSLANRRQFTERLRRAMFVGMARGERQTMLLLDLDDFKQLNDTLGHVAGDALLRLIGPRIRRVLRGDDMLARLGGDEFAVLLAPGSDSESGEAVAAKVAGALAQPFLVNGLSLRITASIGIATYPEDGTSLEDLLKHADVAMYEAKRSRSGHARYAQDRDTHTTERLVIANELAQAIDRGELEVHFQPQVDPERVIRSAEALVRWRRADGRLVPPDDFLAVVEQAGLSRALTRRVLHAALDQLLAWREAGHRLSISVNTTVADLLDERFPDEVEDALAVRGLPADALVLEVTETSIISDPVRVGAVLARLDRLGVCLSLDDFGTGFSSLERLRSLPVGELKIDRTFVSRMAVDPTDAAIVQATTLLAHQLGIRIVAEGVEDAETWGMLADLGCELLQGYEFSRPVPAPQFSALLPERPEPGSIRPAGRMPL